MKTEENNNNLKYDLKYTLGEVIGKGTYGKVYKSHYNESKFAIKKINKLDGGVHITTIREIKILKRLDHKNIIKLIDINVCDDEIYMAFEYYRFDLQNYLKKNIPNKREIIHLTKQICEGIKYLHDKKIIHRDLKSSNILIDFDLNVKIADFGMAIFENSKGKYSPGVVTLWYRPPELLLGTDKYDNSVDLWSLGCILAEIIIGRPPIIGNTDGKVLESIIYFCGSINDRTFPGVDSYPSYHVFKLPQSPRNLRIVLKTFFNEFIDIIDGLLQVYPPNRLQLDRILDNKIFLNYEPEFINDLSKRYKMLNN